MIAWHTCGVVPPACCILLAPVHQISVRQTVRCDDGVSALYSSQGSGHQGIAMLQGP